MPDAVGVAFEARGHHVTFGNRLVRGLPDQLVCAEALNDGAILVAGDHDMKRIARGFGLNNRRFTSLSLIKLSCRAPDAAEKVRQAMSVIEHEWQCGHAREGRRLWVELMRDTIRIVRQVP